MTHLFFVTSISEAKEAIARINRLSQTDSFSIISNNPLTNLFLADHHFPFRDSGEFFPIGKELRTHQLKITSVAKQWAKSAGIDRLLEHRGYQLSDIVSFSLFIYLAEVEHSLLVAKNILKNVNPDVVHVSDRWTESPFRRYQTEKLNLENLALESLSRSNRIQVNPLSQKTDVSLPIKNTLQIVAKFISSLFQSFPVRQNSINPSAISPLVILANYYQLTNLFPFLSRLKARHLDFTAIGKAVADQLELLHKSGIPFFPVGSSHTISSSLQAIRYFNLWRQLKPKMARLFSSYHPLYWNLIKEKLRYLFIIEFPQIIDYLNQAEKIFFHKPKVLLTMATNDTFSRCFTDAAIRHGTRIVELQHGLVIFDEEAPFRKNDLHAIWGTPLNKIMNQGNRNRSSLAVTGFPYFEKYKNIKTSKHKKIKTLTILILATFPVAADRLITKTSPYLFLEMILKTIKSQHKNWKITFRPHPSCKAAWVTEIAHRFSVNLTFDQRETPLDQAISSCDLVISNFTTAMVETMFIGKPILLYSFADTEMINLASHPLITTGATILFSSADELISLMDRMNQKKFIKSMLAGQKKFLKQYCSVRDQAAVTRLSNLVKNVITKK